MLILLIALALYIFWLLFRNGPAFAERGERHGDWRDPGHLAGHATGDHVGRDLLLIMIRGA